MVIHSRETNSTIINFKPDTGYENRYRQMTIAIDKKMEILPTPGTDTSNFEDDLIKGYLYK